MTMTLARCSILLALTVAMSRGNQVAPKTTNPAALKLLTLEELSAMEITTPSKEPQPSRRDLCNHGRGYPPVRRNLYPGSAAQRARRGSGPH